MHTRTHYDNLQVSNAASAEVIRASYKVLMQKYHPDRYPDRERGERVCKIISEAFGVIGDPKSRAAYDARLRAKPAVPTPPAEDNSSAPSRESREAPPPPPVPTATSSKRGMLVQVIGSVVAVTLFGAILSFSNRPPGARPAVQAPSRAAIPPSAALGLNAASDPVVVPSPPSTGGYRTTYSNRLPHPLTPGSRVFKIASYKPVVGADPSAGKVYRIEEPLPGEPIGPTLVQADFKSGIQEVKIRGAAIIPFRVVLPKSESTFYLKLVGLGDKKRPLISMLGRGGEVLNIKVPAGTYRLRYMSGPTWFGPVDKFGPGVSGSESEANLTFERNGNDLSGNEVVLIEQAGGNLRHSGVLADDFE